MKGKNGKPSAMRGGGIARKGVGMALKGGGVARKGTGSNATPGGKKMADGGMSAMKALPPHLGGSPNPPSDTPNSGPKRSLAVHAAENYGGPRVPGGPRGPRVPGNNRGTPGMVRPGFPSGGIRPTLSGPGQIARPAGASMPTASQLGSGLGAVGGIGGVPQGTDQQAAAQRAMEASMKKNGGKVARYAKGGAVKMTAGAGSGSGRLEKVAAHKAAKRVPATGLKSGGIASSPLAASSSREKKAQTKYLDAYEAAGSPARPKEAPALKKAYKTYTDASSARAKIGAKYVKKAKGK